MNISFKGDRFEKMFGQGEGINSYCYRIMGLIEQDLENKDKADARLEERKPKRFDIKSEFYKTGRNAELENFLRSVGITLENFKAVAEEKVSFNRHQREDIAKALGVTEDAIWY